MFTINGFKRNLVIILNLIKDFQYFYPVSPKWGVLKIN
jgi:hypothetical protein